MDMAEITRSLLEELSKMVRTESVVGEPIQAGNSTVIPVTRVSFGFGTGAGSTMKEKKEPGELAGMGGGASVEPVAFIVITEGKAQLLTIGKKDQLTIGKVIDLIPDLLAQVKDLKGGKKGKGKGKKEAEPEEEKE